MWPHGLRGGCRDGSGVKSVHYVKPIEYGCMEEIHRNLTEGKQVCRTKFCGPPGVCKYKHPTGKNACNVTARSSWETLSTVLSCETSFDAPGVTRMKYDEVLSLTCCKTLCEETCGCNAVDYYTDSGWCNMYRTACKRPRLKKEGSSSYKLLR